MCVFLLVWLPPVASNNNNVWNVNGNNRNVNNNNANNTNGVRPATFFETMKIWTEKLLVIFEKP